ncbi:hypothetical protein QYF36_009322 [Acer negundo]|nr:hypothetical protein QYF36_009322 [Acer negundo]
MREAKTLASSQDGDSSEKSDGESSSSQAPSQSTQSSGTGSGSSTNQKREKQNKSGGIVMFVMRLHRLGIPLPGSEPRTPTTFVHGVHIMFKLKIEGSSQEIEVGSSQKFQESESLLKSTTPAKRIVYTSTRPTDIKTPYKKMLDNQVEFGSPDKRSGGFLNSALIALFYVAGLAGLLHQFAVSFTQEYIISNCTELIEKHKGKLLVKEEPRVVSEWDDKLLAEEPR